MVGSKLYPESATRRKAPAAGPAKTGRSEWLTATSPIATTRTSHSDGMVRKPTADPSTAPDAACRSSPETGIPSQPSGRGPMARSGPSAARTSARLSAPRLGRLSRGPKWTRPVARARARTTADPASGTRLRGPMPSAAPGARKAAQTGFPHGSRGIAPERIPAGDAPRMSGGCRQPARKRAHLAARAGWPRRRRSTSRRQSRRPGSPSRWAGFQDRQGRSACCRSWHGARPGRQSRTGLPAWLLHGFLCTARKVRARGQDRRAHRHRPSSQLPRCRRARRFRPTS